MSNVIVIHFTCIESVMSIVILSKVVQSIVLVSKKPHAGGSKGALRLLSIEKSQNSQQLNNRGS